MASSEAPPRSELPPRIPRVRVPAFDDSELRRKHSLTIIGRLTNPAAQRLWSMIPCLADLWKTSSRPIGADLGQGRFQFQFANEQDLLKVLENQPYHYAKWMVILQRWEPTTSASFPSQIPFWIDVQGIPVHLWSQETLSSVAKGVGHFERAEITTTFARIRVMVNGLQPLIKQTFVDFADGEEALADLVYDKLEKHCKKCNMLDHEDKDCPMIRTSRARRDPPPPSPPPKKSHREAEDSKKRSQDRPHDGPQRRTPQHSGTKRTRSPDHRRDYGNRSRDSHWSKDRDGFTSRRYGDNKSLSPQRSFSYKPSGHHSHSLPAFEERRKTRSPYKFEESRRSYPRVANAHSHSDSRDISSTSKTAHPGPCLPARESSTQIPQAALNVAMGELRDVMIKYVNCADPTESAARRERYRQAEDLGQFEETAEQMVRASLQIPSERPHESPTSLSGSHERIPATLRLGPPALPQRLAKSKKRVTGKKKLGRPPGKKNVSQKNPKIPVVGAGKRRRTLHPVPSPRRRLNMDSYLEGAEEDATLNAGPSSGPLPVPTEARARVSPPFPSPRLSGNSKGSSVFRVGQNHLP